jgi:hypothetical protein
VADESAVTDEKRRRELEILKRILGDLQELDPEGRLRVLQTASTYYQLSPTLQPRPPVSGSDDGRPGPFSEDRSISPKDFIMQKQPQTDVETVACLAYYLTHYRDTPHFKTLDISKLNTDAAQPKFSNAPVAVDNAMKTGYLVPATKGNKQLSGPGELFVLKLPDRDAARVAMATTRLRRKSKKASQGEESPRAQIGGEKK